MRPLVHSFCNRRPRFPEAERANNLQGIVMSRTRIVSAIAATITLMTGAAAPAAGPDNGADSFRVDYSMRQNDGFGQISDVYLPSRS